MLLSKTILFLFFEQIIKLNFSFILSPGRTGTRSLGLLLNSLPQVLSRHEPRPSILDLSVGSKSKLMTDSKIFRNFLNRRALYFHRAFFKNQVYCESNYSLTFISHILFKNIISAKAVFITRNPENYIRSAYSKEFGKHNDSAHRLFDEKDKRIRISTKLFKEYDFVDWDKLSRFEKVCWNFRLYHEFYLNLKSKGYPIKIFYFEELFSNKLTFFKLLTELGILASEIQKNELFKSFLDPINHNSKYIIGDFSSWSDKDKKSFKHIIEPLYSHFDFNLDVNN